MSEQFAWYLTAGGLQKGPLHGGYSQQYGYRHYSGQWVRIFDMETYK